MIFLRNTLFLFLSISLLSCAHTQLETERIAIPRTSFVEIKALVRKPDCRKDRCGWKVMAAFSSGVIIKRDNIGSYVLGAEHVCRIQSFESQPDVKVRFTVMGVGGTEYIADVLVVDKENDLCVFYVRRMRYGQIVKIRNHPPKFGEKVYNLASPLGFAHPPTTIPVFIGHYSGFKNGMDVYTIPAKGGSSGSPIFDVEGKLLGILVGHLKGFNQISVSPRFSSVKKIVDEILSGKYSVGGNDD